MPRLRGKEAKRRLEVKLFKRDLGRGLSWTLEPKNGRVVTLLMFFFFCVEYVLTILFIGDRFNYAMGLMVTNYSLVGIVTTCHHP